eukprot:5154159-Lingulodinium_polyedra.AAC.1
MSPAFPFDHAVPPRTRACGRTNAKDYGLLIVLNHRNVLKDFEVRKNPTGHLVTQDAIPAEYITQIYERVELGSKS